METYEWQKNKAVVDRLYYAERILETSTFFAAYFTAVSMMYIRKNYIADMSKRRITKVWTYWGVGNLLAAFILLRPLTKDEIAIQWRKRQIMGKWLYSLYHLDPIEDPKTAAANTPNH